MDKQGGFLKFKRKPPEYRDVAERLADFKPVEVPANEEDVVVQAARCMDCGTPFCHGCGCPLGNVMPELNDMVLARRWKDALQLLLSTNNFPEFTARVCPALCEASCVLGIHDEPVTIRQIELAVIEKAFQEGFLRAQPPKVRCAERVAVVGSGPAGLAVADTLNRAGYSVVVYDREKRAGGILRYGIPDFKLEKGVIDRRIALMKEEGIIFELGVFVGDDISYHYMQQRFDAICLAGGARQPRDLNIPGRELKGIHFAMAYLTQQNMILAGEDLAGQEIISAEGKNVVILGGGDTGSDCLGTALRQGAAHVSQFEILPRPPEKRSEATPWPMWPDMVRESSSHKEGGERRWGVGTRAFRGENGQVRSLCGVEMECRRDAHGRLSFVEKSGTEFEVKAELVLLALGFTGPVKNALIEDWKLALDERGNLRTDERHMTSVEGVFSAGDMAAGQSLVVRAIADGRDAARGIMDYLEHHKVMTESKGRKS